MRTKHNIGETVIYYNNDTKIKSEITISEIRITGEGEENIWYFDKLGESCSEDEIIGYYTDTEN